MAKPGYRFQWVLRDKDEKYHTDEGEWDSNISNARVYFTTRDAIQVKMQKLDRIVTAYEVTREEKTKQMVFAMGGQVVRLI